LILIKITNNRALKIKEKLIKDIAEKLILAPYPSTKE